MPVPALKVAEALAVAVAVADAAPDAVAVVETNASLGPARVSSKLAVSQGSLRRLCLKQQPRPSHG